MFTLHKSNSNEIIKVNFLPYITYRKIVEEVSVRKLISLGWLVFNLNIEL